MTNLNFKINSLPKYIKEQYAKTRQIGASKIIENSEKTTIVPIDYAVAMGLLSGYKVYNTQSNNELVPVSKVESFKLVGGNGIGKTEIVLRQGVEFLKGIGLNPVIYDPLLNDGIAYPENENDVIVIYMSWVGKESQDIEGLPYGTTIQVPVIENNIVKKDKDGNVVYKDTKGLAYSCDKAFASMGNFKYGFFLFDELNRSPELDIANALLNGEKVKGVKMPSVGSIIFAMQNSENDGINIIRTRQDGASNTKSSTFHVYQTSESWANWAMKNGVHPTLIAFALHYSRIFENQKSVSDEKGEIAHPTFRGLTKLSQLITETEYSLKELFGYDELAKLGLKELEALFQSRLGEHPDDPNLKSKFADMFTFMDNNLFNGIKNTILKPYDNEISLGINGKDYTDFNNEIYASSFQNKEFDGKLYPKGFESKYKGSQSDLFAMVKLYALKTFAFSFANKYINTYDGINIFDMAKTYHVAMLDDKSYKKLLKGEMETHLGSKLNVTKEMASVLDQLRRDIIEKGNIQSNVEEIKNKHLLVNKLLDDLFTDYIKHGKYDFYDNILVQVLSKLIDKLFRILAPITQHASDMVVLTKDIGYLLKIDNNTPHYDVYEYLFKEMYPNYFYSKPLSKKPELESEKMDGNAILHVLNKIVWHVRSQYNVTIKYVLASDASTNDNIKVKNYQDFMKSFEKLDKDTQNGILRTFNIPNIKAIDEISYNRYTTFIRKSNILTNDEASESINTKNQQLLNNLIG